MVLLLANLVAADEEPHEPTPEEIAYRGTLSKLVVKEIGELPGDTISLVKTGPDGSSSFMETESVIFICIAIASLIILQFFLRKNKKLEDNDDFFFKQMDEESKESHANIETNDSFNRSFNSLTIKTERSEIFKKQIAEAEDQNSRSGSTVSISGILKGS